MTLEEISQEAQLLDQGEKVQLAYLLMDQVGSVPHDGFTSEQVRQSWIREASRRAADLEAGRSSASDLSEVLARVRSRR